MLSQYSSPNRSHSRAAAARISSCSGVKAKLISPSPFARRVTWKYARLAPMPKRIYPLPMNPFPGTTREPPRAAEVTLVHSSDIHVDDGRRDGAAALRSVLSTAKALDADIILLAGDTFENNQLSADVLDGPGDCSPE